MKIEKYCRIASITFLVLLVVWKFLTFTVDEGHVALRSRFGKLDQVVYQPGMHFKVPGMDSIHTIDARVRPWDGASLTMPTRDKRYLTIDTFARWRIDDPERYFELTRGDTRAALSRIEDVLGSEVQATVASHRLPELIRSTPDRQPELPEEAEEIGLSVEFPTINFGRATLEQEVMEGAKIQLADFGIELLSFHFKRTNYTKEVEREVNARMISERQRIAARYVSEGEREAQRILGSIDERKRTLLAKAERQAQEIIAESRGKAAAIYSDSYGSDDQRSLFYGFYRRMELYPELLSGARLVLPSDSEVLDQFSSGQPKE